MPYPLTLTRARARAPKEANVITPPAAADTTPEYPRSGVSPSDCRMLRAIDRAQAATARSWVSVADVQRVHPHAPTYDLARRQLHRLALAGYLRASPKGQPPGAGGLLFTTTAHARRALTGPCRVADGQL